MDKDAEEQNDSKEFFINYLTQELDQLREEIKSPGWTRWIILASIGSIIWLIIIEIEKIFMFLNRYFCFICWLTLLLVFLD